MKQFVSKFFFKYAFFLFQFTLKESENKTMRNIVFAKFAKLKMISSPYCALLRVFLHTLFESQNVASRNYLHDVNS